MEQNTLPALGRASHSNLKVLGYCLIVGLGVCAFGLDNGETSGFLAMQAFLKDFGYYEPLVGAYNMTAGDQTRMYGIELGFILIGSLTAGLVGTPLGYTKGLVISSAIGIIGPAIQMVSHTAAMICGRAVMGFGAGLGAVFVISYWSEVTPVDMRSRTTILYQLIINISGFVGACINQGTYQKMSPLAYRIPLAVACSIAFLLFVGIWIVPESPRWLVTRGRHEEAKKNIRKIRGSTHSQEELDAEMDAVIAFTTIEEEISASTSYKECLSGSGLRRTIIAVVLSSGQQLMGVGFLSGYQTYFFALSGITNAFIVTVISYACSTAGSICTFWLVRWFDRRPLMLCGGIVNSICMLTFAIVSVAAPGSDAANKCLVAFISIFNFSYSATWGPIVPLMVGEIPANRLRSNTISIAICSSWIFSLAIICGTPYLISPVYANLGTKVGFIFGAITIPVIIFCYFYLPETKDRTLEEIDEMFLNNIPSRKFKSYVCTGETHNMSADGILGVLENKQNVMMVESI